MAWYLAVLIVLLVLILYWQGRGGDVLWLGAVLALAAGAVYIDARTTALVATPVAGGVDARKLLDREALRFILRNSKKGLRSAAAAGASAASMGFGGDTLVEVSFLTLDAAEYLAALTGMFNENEALWRAGLANLSLLAGEAPFRGGPEALRQALVKVEIAPAALAPFCALLRKHVETTLGMTGTIISSFIPNDAGTVGWAASEAALLALRTVGGKPFSVATAAYALVPAGARRLLEDPQRLGVLMHGFVDFLRDSLLSPNTGKWDALKKFAARQALVSAASGALVLTGVGVLLAPVVLLQTATQIVNTGLLLGIGHTQVAWLLENVLRPRIALLVRLLQLALPTCFAMLYWLEKCQAQQESSADGPAGEGGRHTPPPGDGVGKDLREADPHGDHPPGDDGAAAAGPAAGGDPGAGPASPDGSLCAGAARGAGRGGAGPLPAAQPL